MCHKIVHKQSQVLTNILGIQIIAEISIKRPANKIMKFDASEMLCLPFSKYLLELQSGRIEVKKSCFIAKSTGKPKIPKTPKIK